MTAPARATRGSDSVRRTIPPEVRAQVRHVELRTRRLVESLFSGEYYSRFKGRGLEFSDVREYQPGDDVRAIDWNVTARRGKPFVKEFVEERQLNVLLIVDLSASERFGSGAKDHLQVAGELAAVLGLAAARNNDRVGLILVTDRVELFLSPDTGRSHALRLVLELFWHQPTGTRTKLSAALEYATRVLREQSLVFVVSDFLTGPESDPDLEPWARQLAAKHDVVPLRIHDPSADVLPDVGMIAVHDPETGERRVVNSSRAKVREAYAEAVSGHRERMTSTFRRLELEPVEISSPDDYVPPLLAFFRRRGAAR